MNKPEYSDLYKFIASLGLILIGFSILLPWLFLRESFDTLITTSDIANLTPSAQTLILYRQSTALWFVQNIVWLSLIPAIIGVSTLVSGLFLWQRKQRTLDEKDELELEKQRLEIKNMTPEQKAVKLIQEVAEDSHDKKDEVNKAEKQISRINELVHIEKLVLEKLAKCFGSPNVSPDQQIRDIQADLLVRVSRSERAIFEIKYIKNVTYINRRVKELNDVLMRSVQYYKKLAHNRNVQGVGLIILSDDFANPTKEKIDEIKSTMIDNTNIKIISLTESRFSGLSCSDLRSMITNIGR